MSDPKLAQPDHHFLNRMVQSFLESNLSVILILLAAVIGLAALWITPREEDPQIIVPLADIYVQAPGQSAHQVEQLVSTPLEKILYQIDGVEYVYSMSRPGQAIITVRFYVGQDRERSLVKLFKKMDEHVDQAPPGVTGWVVKPVEIDDVPTVALTLRYRDGQVADGYALRRVAEELTQRLSGVSDLSRAYVIGGPARQVQVYLDPQKMQAFSVAPLQIQQAIAAVNVTMPAGTFTRMDQVVTVEAGRSLAGAAELRDLVVTVADGKPVFLKDVAAVVDGPAETSDYVRHSWGPARGFHAHPGMAGTLLASDHSDSATATTGAATTLADESVSPAVTIAIAKKKGANAVWVAQNVIKQAQLLQEQVVPKGMELVISRNYGLTADEKVNELVEALVVAVIIVIALLTIGLGWREALIVAVAVPVVFGLTLAVNLMLGFSINRVTLFALILSLGLLVDDPIVDVENISRHFGLKKKATRRIVLDAVAEIRPPLISATLAVILSFIPMFFITGMMGPYMRPMALNVPVTMLMSMVVAFTITPWMAYHVLKRHYNKPVVSGAVKSKVQGPKSKAVGEAGEGKVLLGTGEAPSQPPPQAGEGKILPGNDDPHDLEAVRQSFLWKLFYPLMAPLLKHRWLAWTFLLVMGLLTVGAMMLAATRHVPLKMLPFDNKNELLLVLDMPEGATLERTDAMVREFERFLRSQPEVSDLTSYVGLASPMDFNGMVRHYYLRQGGNLAEIRVNLAGKKNRSMQSHAIGLRMRESLGKLAKEQGVSLKLVETPPGPPVYATLVAEVYGQPHHRYEDLIAAAGVVRARMEREPLVVDVDDTVEAAAEKLTFKVDREKAALHGVSVEQIARTLQASLAGATVGTMRVESERQPLLIQMRLPRALRSSTEDLGRLHVQGRSGSMIAMAELGQWETSRVDQTIYHKNMQPVVYVFGETAGRAPADAVVDIQADQKKTGGASGSVDTTSQVRPLEGRTFFSNGSGIRWSVPEGIKVDWAGEGEWRITLDVFRDLGLAFGAAMIAIYILLVWQTGSFVVPLIVMLAIPLTVLGVMPGFWLLNAVMGGHVGSFPNPVFFTATGMIGMIALSGIVTRDSIILVDFIHLSLKRGRSLFDAIMESRVVRLRPILLTAGAAMLGAAPIIADPIFSGLAWSLIFGLFASTLFTLFVIPVTYWLLYEKHPRHGLPDDDAMDEA